MFYCMFYFTCDRSLSLHYFTINDAMHAVKTLCSSFLTVHNDAVQGPQSLHQPQTAISGFIKAVKAHGKRPKFSAAEKIRPCNHLVTHTNILLTVGFAIERALGL